MQRRFQGQSELLRFAISPETKKLGPLHNELNALTFYGRVQNFYPTLFAKRKFIVAKRATPRFMLNKSDKLSENFRCRLLIAIQCLQNVKHNRFPLSQSSLVYNINRTISHLISVSSLRQFNLMRLHLVAVCLFLLLALVRDNIPYYPSGRMRGVLRLFKNGLQVGRIRRVQPTNFLSHFTY